METSKVKAAWDNSVIVGKALVIIGRTLAVPFRLVSRVKDIAVPPEPAPEVKTPEVKVMGKVVIPEVIVRKAEPPADRWEMTKKLFHNIW
jgi:hypothetical protein